MILISITSCNELSKWWLLRSRTAWLPLLPLESSSSSMVLISVCRTCRWVTSLVILALRTKLDFRKPVSKCNTKTTNLKVLKMTEKPCLKLRSMTGSSSTKIGWVCARGVMRRAPKLASTLALVLYPVIKVRPKINDYDATCPLFDPFRMLL